MSSAVCSFPDLPLAEMREVAEALFAVEWYADGEGYLTCPGQAQHKNPNGKRDCRIKLDGGKPPTVSCFHGSCRGVISEANFRLRSAIGKAKAAAARGEGGWRPPRDFAPQAGGGGTAAAPAARPQFDPAVLARFAGEWAGRVDLAWLADRSEVDPAGVTASDFLRRLYRPGEKVVVFTKQHSQGQALWPDDELPSEGPEGVWFLGQPVDGRSYPNVRKAIPTMSRRSQESVTSWRYLVLESDDAPARQWLGALVQLPLRIAAIYSSAGKSVHALIRVDARTKDEWDEQKAELAPGLLVLGADPAALTAVRLTRLPGTLRHGKMKDGRYVRFPEPVLQKLLYVQPEPELRALATTMRRRDVVADWLKWAALGISDADETGGAELLAGLRYYAPVSRPCAAALGKLTEAAEVAP